MNIEYTDLLGWVYKYDSKNRIWRAFHNDDDFEINQYHKNELLFCMSKYGSNDVYTLRHLIMTRMPILTMDERSKFITQERFS